ncbi:GH12 family glycosyl hydrolase domain-containing protein [Sorangium sp. So ce1128]
MSELGRLLRACLSANQHALGGMPARLSIALALASGLGCASDTAMPVPGASEQIVSCTPWRREPLAGTETVWINNMWNEQRAKGEPHSQCLLRRHRGEQVQYGWNWSWPAYKPYASYAAPEALFGWKAWDGGASTTTALPRRIDAIDSLKVDFSVEIAADNTYNLNTTMWVTTTDQASTDPNPQDIRNEIMVWFSNPAGLGGGITYDGEVTLDGLVFDVWHLVNQPDASGGTTHTWTMLIYISREQILQRSFDLKLVLDDAVSKGLVDRTHAVGGVELITEVFGGSGRLWLERFDVSVKQR